MILRKIPKTVVVAGSPNNILSGHLMNMTTLEVAEQFFQPDE
jgi:hypothetical protein